jgi:hypothetical protein
LFYMVDRTVEAWSKTNDQIDHERRQMAKWKLRHLKGP